MCSMIIKAWHWQDLKIRATFQERSSTIIRQWGMWLFLGLCFASIFLRWGRTSFLTGFQVSCLLHFNCLLYFGIFCLFFRGLFHPAEDIAIMVQHFVSEVGDISLAIHFSLHYLLKTMQKNEGTELESIQNHSGEFEYGRCVMLLMIYIM